MGVYIGRTNMMLYSVVTDLMAGNKHDKTEKVNKKRSSCEVNFKRTFDYYLYDFIESRTGHWNTQIDGGKRERRRNRCALQKEER